MDEMRAPEVVQRVEPSRISSLSTTIRVIQTRDRDLTKQIKVERDELAAHREQVDAFANRMKFGSAAGWHPEGVMDWLIAQGWTPPADLLLNDTKEES